MSDESYYVGIIKLNTGFSHNKGHNTRTTIKCIKEGVKRGLDLIVGPEWGLASNYSLTDKFAPRDAVNLFAAVYPDVPKTAIKRSRLPYSPREARKLINIIKDITKGSNAIVMPGTMMIYTNGKNLYNVMPVFRDGKVIYSVFKNEDGGSCKFDLDGALHLCAPGRDSEDARVSTFKQNGLHFGVEICADRGLLRTKVAPRSLDVQVLSSCGLDDTETDALKNDGYQICSDGQSGLSYVSTKDGTERLPPLNKSTSASLEIYSIRQAKTGKIRGSKSC